MLTSIERPVRWSCANRQHAIFFGYCDLAHGLVKEVMTGVVVALDVVVVDVFFCCCCCYCVSGRSAFLLFGVTAFISTYVRHPTHTWLTQPRRPTIHHSSLRAFPPSAPTAHAAPHRYEECTLPISGWPATEPSRSTSTGTTSSTFERKKTR